MIGKIAIFAVLLLTMSSLHADDESTQLSANLTGSIEKLARQGSTPVPVAVSNGKITVGKYAVQVTPISEKAGQMSGKFVSAARFEIAVDGSSNDHLTAGTIGIGDSAQDARETAVREWYLSFGSALFRALNGNPTALKAGPFAVYAGAMGIRGEAPGDWVNSTDTMHEKILASLSDLLPADAATIHTLDLKIMAAPGAIDGECRVDGQVSAPILNALKRLPWPKTAPYMFKQSYILKAAGK
jgi:hypothetical protein